MTRTLVVWCQDWPVTAAGLAADVPAAVVAGHRVVVCSAAARVEGVRRGQRRRQAQAACPDLVVLDSDHARDARAFEPVVTAVERLAPKVEIVRPGVCALATRGPARYFGGDEALAARMTAAVATAGVTCRVGVADGVFAAGIAAVRGHGVVAPGGSAAFLAPLPTATLDRAVSARGLDRPVSARGKGARGTGASAGEHAALIDLLGRLGIVTLGAFAALPASDVLGRFGTAGCRAQRLAAGLDERPPVARVVPPDLAVQAELDPPAHRVDVAAFAARGLADRLHTRLGDLGLACIRLRIEAETEHGERLARVWRADGSFTPQGVADRMRWQLDGWLAGTAASQPSGGLSLLRLVADETIEDHGRQLLLSAPDSPARAEDEARAARALAQVQGLLGPNAVAIGVQAGGRGPAEQVRLVPWGQDRPAPADGAPWPRRIPPPWPTTVHADPLPAVLAGDDDTPIGVTGRGVVTAPPARLAVDAGPWREVVAWAGPWPIDERWWDQAGRRRSARCQVATADGAAWLVALAGGRWWVEARY